jgi:hypothetical protein
VYHPFIRQNFALNQRIVDFFLYTSDTARDLRKKELRQLKDHPKNLIVRTFLDHQYKKVLKTSSADKIARLKRLNVRTKHRLNRFFLSLGNTLLRAVGKVANGREK